MRTQKFLKIDYFISIAELGVKMTSVENGWIS